MFYFTIAMLTYFTVFFILFGREAYFLWQDSRQRKQLKALKR
jgi:hypothetical protein